MVSGTVVARVVRVVLRILLQVLTETLGWATIHEKRGPVTGRNPLDAWAAVPC